MGIFDITLQHLKTIQTVRITTIISPQYSTNTVIGLMVEPRFR
jgi:hypothetical protein